MAATATRSGFYWLAGASAAAAHTTVLTGSGSIGKVTLAPNGTITAGVVTIYDAATNSGTVIFQFKVPTGFLGQTFHFDHIVNNGITIDIDNTIANVGVGVTFSPQYG
jgi:hypothetical protein